LTYFYLPAKALCSSSVHSLTLLITNEKFMRIRLKNSHNCFKKSVLAVASRLPGDTGILTIGISDPGTHWLQDPRQIQCLGRVARELFEECINLWPQAQKWHLSYAGPAPGGVIVGQQLNPTMSPRYSFTSFAIRITQRVLIEPSFLNASRLLSLPSGFQKGLDRGTHGAV
jgi:hypothetical protein